MKMQKLLTDTNVRVNASADAARILYNELHDLDHEESWALFLKRNNIPIFAQMITCGTLNSTLMDSRRVVKEALLCNAASVIVFHNHPSGSPEPSPEDIKTTEGLKRCLDVFEIPLLDHIIVGDRMYFSFADNNKTSIK